VTARFFKDEGFEFATELALGSAAYGAAEVGEVLAVVGEIKSGDYDSWCDAWLAAAERVAAIAEACETAGHRRSAFEAQLRASNYFDKASFYMLGTRAGPLRAHLATSPRLLRAGRRPARPAVGERRDPLRGDPPGGLRVPAARRRRGQAASDPQQRFRRNGARHVGTGRRRRKRPRLRLPHVRRARPGPGAARAGTLLPGELGVGDHPGGRLRAHATRGGLGAGRPPRGQPRRLLGAARRRLRTEDRGRDRRSWRRRRLDGDDRPPP
jgi:hypothetical protein